jgi:hypothetical protein
MQAPLSPEDEDEETTQQLKLQDNTEPLLDSTPLSKLSTPTAPQRATEPQGETPPSAGLGVMPTACNFATGPLVPPSPTPGAVTPSTAHHENGASSPLDGLLDRVRSPLEPELLPSPAAAPPRMTRRRRPPASATRHSHRNLNRKKQVT